MRINQPNDIYEKEAEKIANHVVGNSSNRSQSRIAKKNNYKTEKGGIIQDSLINESNSKITDVPLKLILNGGHSLPTSLRTQFEPILGYKFKKTRIHTNPEAAKSAKYLNARAYTIGHNIIFGEGEYAPHSTEGLHLIIHELIHEIQQNQQVKTHSLFPYALANEDNYDWTKEQNEVPIQAKLLVNHPEDRFKKEADVISEKNIDTTNQVKIIQQYRYAPENTIQLQHIKEGKKFPQPGSVGAIADVIAKIREDREKKFKKLEQQYREHLMKKAGIRPVGKIKTPQEALKILRTLKVDLTELNSRIPEIQSSTTNRISGKKTLDEIDRKVEKEVATMSKNGQNTLNMAVSAIKKEEFLDSFIKTHDVKIIPDQPACEYYNAYIERKQEAEPLPGAQTARRLIFIVHVCKNIIEKGDVSEVRSLIAHELSHAIELEVAGESAAYFITNPLIDELVEQLIQIPKYKGYEKPLKQFLYEKIGAYGLKELFAKLQQIPHTKKYQQGDEIRDLVICEYRRIDTLKFPQDIRDLLLNELQLKTETLYDIRISFAEEPYKSELIIYKNYTLNLLETAKDVRKLIEVEGKDPYPDICKPPPYLDFLQFF